MVKYGIQGVYALWERLLYSQFFVHDSKDTVLHCIDVKTMREHDFFLTIHKLVIYHILKEIDYISVTPLNKQGTIFSQCFLVVGDYPVGEC